jgi:hypothetical protein
MKNKEIRPCTVMRLAITVILVLALPLAFQACEKSGNNEKVDDSQLPNDVNPPVATSVRKIDAMQLLGIAADRTFEKNAGKPYLKDVAISRASKSNIIRLAEENTTPVVRYPFDYIKIYDVVRFSSESLEIPIIQEKCGEGAIDVLLANFDLFIYKGKDSKDSLEHSIGGESMIVFKGELGMYCCILNSYMSDGKNIQEFEFSSHKHFINGALEKDFTPPTYQFYVKFESEVTLNYSKDHIGGLVGYSFIPPNNWVTLNNREAVSAEEMFSITDLSALPAISQQCRITGIEDGYFTVETSEESNLETVYFDEYTEFFKGEEQVTPASVAIGDVVTITFGKLYEAYNPKKVFADKIAF